MPAIPSEILHTNTHKELAVRLILPDFPGGTVEKNPPANAGDMGSIPGWGRFPMPQGSQAPAPQLPEPHALRSTSHNYRCDYRAPCAQSPRSAAGEATTMRSCCTTRAVPTHCPKRKPSQSKGDPAQPKKRELISLP